MINMLADVFRSCAATFRDQRTQDGGWSDGYDAGYADALQLAARLIEERTEKTHATTV